MELPDMNNIYVTHKGKEVSIAQHRKRPHGLPDEHEIACIEATDTIWYYGRSLDSLINRLIEVRDNIDKGEYEC